MFSLTHHERKVLIIIASLILCGAVLKFLNVNFSRQKAFKETELLFSANAQNQKTSTQQNVINVNSASQKELENLPGIGPEIANRIVIYRETKGRFTTPEDLKKVKGIGEKKLEKIKECISF